MAIPAYKRILLTLTSPHMQDGHGVLKGTTLVQDTQYLLKGHSKDARNGNKSFGDFDGGKLDGEYGSLTASAVRQAKWFLGYPKNQVNASAGPIFQSYLRGEEKIPYLYSLRRQSRLKPITVRQAAFNRAITQVGVKENPAESNEVLFSKWYGEIGPWCAMFVTWNYVLSGSKRLVRGHTYAYVPFIYDDAKAGRNGLHLTSEPVQGDIVIFQFPGYLEPDHTGLFDKWIDRRNGVFATIEGNTSTGNNNNGGEVMRRQRYTSNIRGFVRVIEP